MCLPSGSFSVASQLPLPIEVDTGDFWQGCRPNPSTRWRHRSQPTRRTYRTGSEGAWTSSEACGGVQTVSEHSPARDDEWRQRQAELDAQAIMQGMAQARQRAEQLARTGR
jgi:hypothetical protein